MRSPRALRARISRSALQGNAHAVAAPDAVADLRRDAYGHGIVATATLLAAAGVRTAVVDEADREAALLAGVTAVDAAASIHPRDLFGLPGGGGEPVMRLVGSVLSLKALRAGEGVSYNYTHVAEHDTIVALVSGGYGQGLVRALGNRARVEIAGVSHPIVGRVAMDVCMVDVGHAPVQIDDEVVFFGGTGPSAGALQTWEQLTGLRATELVCTLGLHVDREVVA